MEDLKKELLKIVDRIKAIENAFLRIKVLIFPTDEGKLVVPKYDGDPASPSDGEIWYDYTNNKFRKRVNGVSSDLS